MPITPFHFGPGALLKSLFPKWFSFRVFLLTQVIMDLETAWNIIQGNLRLHTYFHSYLGSSIVIALSASAVVAHNFVKSGKLTGWVSLLQEQFLFTAVLGVCSHVFLDSIMHSDMSPWRPFSDLNPALHIMSVATLHVFCLSGFVLAAAIQAVRHFLR